jgi:hypothetical protein
MPYVLYSILHEIPEGQTPDHAYMADVIRNGSPGDLFHVEIIEDIKDPKSMVDRGTTLGWAYSRALRDRMGSPADHHDHGDGSGAVGQPDPGA